MKDPARRVGIYALIIRVQKESSIRIGHLGRIRFGRGVYVYIGSALNSLEGRVSRYFKRTKILHWHIDYLLARPTVHLLRVASRPTTQKLECKVSRQVQRKAVSGILGFGCSDCDCDSHLHSFRTIRGACRILSALGFAF